MTGEAALLAESSVKAAELTYLSVLGFGGIFPLATDIPVTCPFPSVLSVTPFTTSILHAAVAPDAEADLSCPDTVAGA